MKRRSKAGSAKSRRRKTAAPKRGNAPNVVRNRSASIAGQETVLARLTYERDEALMVARGNNSPKVVGISNNCLADQASPHYPQG